MRLDIRSSAIKIKLAVTFLSFLFLTACGGGGGGGGGLAAVTPPAVTPAVVIDSTMPDVSNFMATSFKPHEYYRRFCESPREGTDDKQGSVLIENYWLRSWTHDLYLWYSQVNYSNPAFFNDKIEYFNTLKTNALTPSGNPVDRFHFIYDTDEWELMSESGVKTGYGMSHATTNSSLPRQVYVQYVELNSPAFNAGIRRGTRIIEVDGADLLNGNTQSDFDTFNAGLFPEGNNELHSFVMLHPGDTSNSSFSMTSTAVTTSPVLISDVKTTTTGKVGYLVFNSHVAASEQQLVDVFTEFEAEGVSDLILDLRYNGGGLLAIASQIAYMITGAADTAGKIFESLIFNDQHQVLSPITGIELEPLPFIDETVGFSAARGQALPSLGLRKVYILTGAKTCSASESIINGLLGINIEVVLLGSTTCGKPYGFVPFDNCGTTYFTIMIKGENDIGFGSYSDGFSPANTTGTRGVLVPGCSALDDLGNALGDVNEGLLATALEYRDTLACPTPPSAAAFGAEAFGAEAPFIKLIDSKILQQPFSMDFKVFGIPL